MYRKIGHEGVQKKRHIYFYKTFIKPKDTERDAKPQSGKIVIKKVSK